MPNPFDPGAIWDPGTAAGYVYGTNAMRLVCVHKTAGNDSYGIVKNGHLAQWLIPYEGKRWQFAEADAICWDSPPNQDGPGFEIEAPVLVYGGVRQNLSLFRPMSDSQINETGELVHWLNDEWGVPLDLWDGGWVPAGPPGFHGFANHGDIDPPNARSDGMTREEWDACLGGAWSPPPPPSTGKKGSKGMCILIDYATQRCWLVVGNVRVQDFDWTPAGAYGIPQQALDYDNGRGLIMAVGTMQMDLVDKVSKALIDLTV